MDDTLRRMLTVYAEADFHEGITWFTAEQQPHLKEKAVDGFLWHVNCSDVFWWGSADGETVTADNIGVFEQAFRDAKEHPEEAAILFCARVRGMRPQGAMYPHLDKTTWPLFDACGPEREISFGNPKPRPES